MTSRRRILYIGARSGTALQRARTLQELGHDVVHVAAGLPPMGTPRYQLHRIAARLSRPGGLRRFADLYGTNRRAGREARRGGFDLVWVDRGLAVRATTLAALREALPNAVSLHFSLDDMANPLHQSTHYLACVPLYDLHVTNKSFLAGELEAMGARRVQFVDNAYDPDVHRPLELATADRERYAAAVGFVGHWEQERGDAVLALAREGITVHVHGPAWKPLRGAHPRLVIGRDFLHEGEYPKCINATEINLGFLRKGNRDLQTTRSVEIPACAAFMLAERTQEHLRLFAEGVEAEYFDGLEELLRKCRSYLSDPGARRRVAAAGHDRCLASDYSYRGQLQRVLDVVEELALTRRRSRGAASSS